MKFIPVLALIAIASLTACQDTQPSRTETVKTAKPIQSLVFDFDCVPETRADFVNDRMTRESPIDAEAPTLLKVTTMGSDMRLSVTDTHLNAVREFTNSKPFGKGYVQYTTSFTYNGRNISQRFLLPADALDKSRFPYQRVTEMVSAQDGVTNLTVIFSGMCTQS